MTANGRHVPKYARVAAAVKGQITDGTLRPGQPAPSGAALSRVTGYSTLTCRRALRVLIADGVLLPGPSRNARPRVAGPPQQPAERDLAAAARALSAGLAARRRASGLTQLELAALLGVSVTTVGHAETGRLWQARPFWEHADAVLGAGGGLLRLHEAYGEATASRSADSPASAGPAGPAGSPAPAEAAGSAADEAGSGAGADEAAVAGAAAGLCGAVRAAGPGTCLPGGPHGASPAAPGQSAPACVMIMWGDGTVTTVRPPGTPEGALVETSVPGETSPGASRPD
jgi:DNA-binding transcriptional regulator YhcF (GntR family)/DNA-binding XRE family transcriptional regulator